MNRNELIAQIQSILPIADNWIELNRLKNKTRRAVDDLEKEMNKKEPGIKSFLNDLWECLAISFMFGGSIIYLVMMFVVREINIPVICYCGLGLTAILTAWSYQKTIKDYKKLKEELPGVKQEYEDARERFAREVSANMYKIYAIFPKDYANPGDIKKLYSYLVNGRADNMKEAINLLEHENYQEEQNRRIEDLNNQIFDMQRTQRELESRVADAEMEADRANRRLNQ